MYDYFRKKNSYNVCFHTKDKYLSQIETEHILNTIKNGGKLEKKYIGKTLLLKWQGKNPNLNPILLTGHYDVVPANINATRTWEQDPFAGFIYEIHLCIIGVFNIMYENITEAYLYQSISFFSSIIF